MSDYQIDNEDFLTIYLEKKSLEVSIGGKISIGIDIVLEPPSATAAEIADEALSARVLTADKIADVTISALQVVYLSSYSNCDLADSANLVTGMAFGIALNAGNAGDVIKIRIFGILEDAFFVYPLNEVLFVGSNGAITTVQPTTGVLTPIGFGLGPGAIRIAIERPINL